MNTIGIRKKLMLLIKDGNFLLLLGYWDPLWKKVSINPCGDGKQTYTSKDRH
jgi:hypothetical protein